MTDLAQKNSEMVKNIFLVEDDEFFALAFIKRLKKIDNFKIHHFMSCELAFEQLLDFKPEIIFLDHLLGGINGVDALPQFKEMLPQSEIVIVSNQQDLEVMKAALELGAAKYFAKDSLVMENTIGFIDEIIKRPSGYGLFWKNFFGSYTGAFSDIK